MANNENLVLFTSENQPKNRGRKKGQKNFKTIYKKFLKQAFKKSELEEITGFEIPFLDNEDEKLTIQEAIVLRHLKKTLGKADYKDIELIMNRVDGLLKQNIGLSGCFNIDNFDIELTEKEENKYKERINDFYGKKFINDFENND